MSLGDINFSNTDLHCYQVNLLNSQNGEQIDKLVLEQIDKLVLEQIDKLVLNIGQCCFAVLLWHLNISPSHLPFNSIMERQ